MSKSVDTNLSVAGDASQGLSLKAKIGLALIAGAIAFLTIYISGANLEANKNKIIGAIALFLMGTGIFTFRKWYQTLGSQFFFIGLFIMYLGYQSRGDDKYFAIIGAFTLMLLGTAFFTYDPNKKNYFRSHYGRNANIHQKLGTFAALLGFSIIVLSWISTAFMPEEGEVSKIYNALSYFADNAPTYLTLSISLMGGGILWYSYGTYAGHPKGIKNNYAMFNSLSSRGAIGWVVGIVLTIFYIQLYWHAKPLARAIDLFDPLSQILRGKDADQWFLYGTMYTVVILFLGIKFIIKYRHNRYQLIRTCVVIFSQLVFAYFVPYIMESMNYDSATAVVEGKSKYLGYYSANPVNVWPLNKDAFSNSHLSAYTQEAYQPVGLAYLFWGIIMFLIVTPVVTYFVGKRWYCSWFCGCGGLAETAGDSFRHLSNKSVKAWKIERWVIHSVMVFVLIATIGALYPYLSKKEYAIGFGAVNKNSFYFFWSALLIAAAAGLFYLRAKKFKKNNFLLAGGILASAIFILLSIAYFGGTEDIFLIDSKDIKKGYAFFIGASFSGVIGVGFYPILGNRVWCRFGCPMAGYMGLFQRFKSKFRITTNGSQCISCGNCSTYCEQGIDVRAYAQKGENIVRASCVGCGVCSAVCPRGVLKLENGPEEDRFEPNPLVVSKDGVTLNM